MRFARNQGREGTAGDAAIVGRESRHLAAEARVHDAGRLAIHGAGAAAGAARRRRRYWESPASASSATPTG